jgi:hypothetical protein
MIQKIAFSKDYTRAQLAHTIFTPAAKAGITGVAGTAVQAGGKVA